MEHVFFFSFLVHLFDGKTCGFSGMKRRDDGSSQWRIEVKDMFPDQRKVWHVLEVMKDFKNRSGYKIILNVDDEVPQRKTDYLDLAMSLVNKIKERLGNDHEFKSFLNIMSMHRKKGKGIKQVYQEVQKYFSMAIRIC
ncbi:hypothetical protein HAX54_002758 [Datura stramonium]|uniref:Uncharacterized protein n=1 Tax=Datura stramonium TaxID=4076 RepID=A0ABS8WVF0_DATST|nr:hypothetical protein [Datura stramonium]